MRFLGFVMRSLVSGSPSRTVAVLAGFVVLVVLIGPAAGPMTTSVATALLVLAVLTVVLRFAVVGRR